MNGLFNERLMGDVVIDGASGGPVFWGRKVFVLFLLLIAVCFVGGFASKAQAQPVHEQGPVSSSEGGDEAFSTFGFGSNTLSVSITFTSEYATNSGTEDEPLPLPTPAPKCYPNKALGRIKDKLGWC
ncbi:hypothetical protein [Pseudomonas sp. MWU12-2037]|uniref:hypothetical protein n=1 Tax=Pseudomonas sp. MWU12-2037 TaxID=2928690 RepID=UPI0020105F7F|nr:hypothetical protein [Pseudomonas sp. MWU12-2037]